MANSARTSLPHEPVVRAILFYSPTCPHCADVMEDHLPPLLDRYGPRLRIAAVSTMSEGGQALFRAMVLHFRLPPERVGVPTLVVGSDVLVGAREIPDHLPGIVEGGLARGGVDWPAVPLIREAVAAAGLEAEPAMAASPPASWGGPASRPEPPVPEPPVPEPPVSEPPVSEPAPPRSPATAPPSGAMPAPLAPAVDLQSVDHAVPDLRLSPVARFRLDPVGNGLAVVVLMALLAALGAGVRPLATPADERATASPWPPWVVPVLAAVGLGVAGYLAVVEVSGTDAVCGPVGDCNTVQQSEFARLFGVAPVGLLGVGGYVVLLAGWVLSVAGPPQWRRIVHGGLWATALTGTLFSLYLTFLEPFVIGASCLWCLSSALVMALLLLATAHRPEPGPAPSMQPATTPSGLHSRATVKEP